MKLPEKIKGRNRIRDGAIVLFWTRDNTPTEQIAEKFKLTQRRIEQILSANHAFVTIDKEFEKKKRIFWLKSQLKKRGDTSRDSMEVQEQLRKEIEGDKPLIDQSTHYQQIVYVRQDSHSNDSVQASRIPTTD